MVVGVVEEEVNEIPHFKEEGWESGGCRSCGLDLGSVSMYRLLRILLSSTFFKIKILDKKYLCVMAACVDRRTLFWVTSAVPFNLDTERASRW